MSVHPNRLCWASGSCQIADGCTSITGTIMITWEGILFVYQYGLIDGGPLGSIIGYLFCWVGYTLVALCLGELNSIFPTAGGQYREYH